MPFSIFLVNSLLHCHKHFVFKISSFMKVFHLFPLLIPCSPAPYPCVPPRGAHAASVFALNAGAVSFGQIVKVGKFQTKSERERNGE